MTTTIGFIGLGAMGALMARNILASGFSLAIVTSSKEKAELFSQLGARVASSPRELASIAGIVVSCVPDGAALAEIVSGDHGLASFDWKDGLLIDCSTVSSADVRAAFSKLQTVGASMVDSPVSGGIKGAEAGSLVVMCGGRDEDFARSRPVLDAIGQSIRHVGGLGAGQVMKACNQLMISVNMMGVYEAIALARVNGVDPALMRELLLTGSARSGVLEAHAQRYLANSLEGGFRLSLLLKDLRIANELGSENGNFQPAAALAEQLVGAACRKGLGGYDSAAAGVFYDMVNEVV